MFLHFFRQISRILRSKIRSYDPIHELPPPILRRIPILTTLGTTNLFDLFPLEYNNPIVHCLTYTNSAQVVEPKLHQKKTSHFQNFSNAIKCLNCLLCCVLRLVMKALPPTQVKEQSSKTLTFSAFQKIEEKIPVFHKSKWERESNKRWSRSVLVCLKK